MDEERIVLKKSPPLEFIFGTDSVQIINLANKSTDGIYKYSEITKVDYALNRVNWFWTILNSIFYLIFDLFEIEAFREKKKLHISTADKKMTIDLFDCEQLQIDKVLTNLTKLTSKPAHNNA